jgi:hypothetical protein
MARPPTDAERAQERVLEQRWQGAELAFKRWDAKRVRTSTPLCDADRTALAPVRTSLIG